jgi:DNA-binding SARP family transcriptional activator
VRRNLETAIRRRREAGDTVGALRYVEDLLAHDPWREDVLRDLMDLRWRIGDRAGALATFRDFSRRLRTELAADPMPETVHVVQTISQRAFQVA